MVDIKGLDKARVLKALYDHSHLQGMDCMKASGPVTVEHCAKLLEKQTRFDYLYGRVLKVELSGDEFDERRYDWFCGEGAARRAVDSIKDAPEDGEKKELTMEEKVKLTKDTARKVLDILMEVPPDVTTATCVILKTLLPGPSISGMTGMLLMMGGQFPPPPFKNSDAQRPKERDIMSAGPFGPFGGIGK